MAVNRLSFCCSGIFLSSIFLSSFFSIDHLNDKKFNPRVAILLSKFSISPPNHSFARTQVQPPVLRSFAMCRKVSLLHTPPSAALWSLSTDLGDKMAQKSRKRLYITIPLWQNDTLTSRHTAGPTRNLTGVARTVQTRLVQDEGSEPEVITATL